MITCCLANNGSHLVRIHTYGVFGSEFWSKMEGRTSIIRTSNQCESVILFHVFPKNIKPEDID